MKHAFIGEGGPSFKLIKQKCTARAGEKLRNRAHSARYGARPHCPAKNQGSEIPRRGTHEPAEIS